MTFVESDPQTSRAVMLARELRIVLGTLKRRLREQTHLGDLSWSQASVLSLLEREGPATVTALARAERMRPQSMGATVSMLEAAGHIRGEPDPDDGRRTILSLTPSCRKWIKATRAAREDWLFNAIQSKLVVKEQQQLAAAVELLNRIANS